MNKLFSTLLIFSFVIAIPITVSAQRNPAKSADEAFSKQQYSLAIDKYKKAYTKVKKNKEEKNRITAQLAECYRLTGNFKRASISYKRLIKNDYDKRNPELLLHYANMLKMTGNYDEAINQYNAYALRVPEDPRGVNGAESTALIEEWIANPSKYEVTNVKKINSREADFAPAYTTDNYNEIVFTSTREGATGKETDKWTAQNFSDLFVAKIDRKDEWSEPVLFDATEKLNTNANEGAAVFNSKFNTIYFTRCPNDQQKESGCQIYKARRTGRTWSEAEMVEMVGIDTLSTIGQPTISEGELVIYFAANRRNGLGGKDIWVAFRDSKSEPFGRPMNLGETINTPGDEMFPFLRNDTTLFFASDGHGGMGGLDIFVTKIDTSGNWGEPKNLKYPINSISDDFAIVFHPTDEYGFLSSSRKGSRGLEDIWYFIEPPLLFSLSGTVRDDRTLMTMGDVNVQLIGSSGISVTTRTNDEGFYSFGESQLETNTMYEVLVAKPNYFNTKGTFTTVGVEFSKDFVKDFNLIPIPPLDGSKVLFALLNSPKYDKFLHFLESRGPFILLFLLILDNIGGVDIFGRMFRGIIEFVYSLIF